MPDFPDLSSCQVWCCSRRQPSAKKAIFGFFWYQRRQLALSGFPSVCEQACLLHKAECFCSNSYRRSCSPCNALLCRFYKGHWWFGLLSCRRKESSDTPYRMDSISKDVFCTSVSPQTSPNILDRIQYGVTMALLACANLFVVQRLLRCLRSAACNNMFPFP